MSVILHIKALLTCMKQYFIAFLFIVQFIPPHELRYFITIVICFVNVSGKWWSCDGSIVFGYTMTTQKTGKLNSETKVTPATGYKELNQSKKTANQSYAPLNPYD